MTKFRLTPISLSARNASLLSAGALAALVAGYGLAALAAEPGTGLAHAAKLLKLGGVLGAIVVFVEGHFMQVHGNQHLDERERGERDRALALCHRLLAAVLFAGFLYGSAAVEAGWWLPAPSDAVGLLFVVALAMMLLPPAILSWRVREIDHQR